MAARLITAARRAGFDDHSAHRIAAFFEAVMVTRAATFPDEHDPQFLHPGRTALILMDDVGTRDVATILAAMALDSVHVELTPSAAQLAAWGAEEAVPILDEIASCAEGDALLENFLAASVEAREAVLAERLDHARHLHLSGPADWPAFHERVVLVHLPLATRTDPTLERRYRWWTSMFRKRFLHR
jgi:hypothetical protein